MAPRTIWKRALLCCGIYGLLLLLWPVVRFAYAPLFRAGAEFALGVADPFHGEIRVRFDPENGPAQNEDMPHLDSRLRLQHREMPGADALSWASSFFHGYQPTAVLLALFLGATPLAWKLRRWRLLWAALALHAFLALRCFAGVFYIYSKSTIAGRPALDLSPGEARAVYWIWHFLCEEPCANYVVPILIWLLCAGSPGVVAAPIEEEAAGPVPG